MSPRNPRFCNPMTELNSPPHTSLGAPLLAAPPVFSDSPNSEPHSELLMLAVALSSSLGGRPVCGDTAVLICRPALDDVRSNISRPFWAPCPFGEPSDSIGARLEGSVRTKEFVFRIPPMPRPPPAAMAEALKTAAAFLESRKPWRRSTTDSRRPSIR
jgi:hypothetical protein